MLIDCDSCAIRGAACARCVVSALFDPPRAEQRLTADVHRAIEVFTRAGFDVEVIDADPAAEAGPIARRASPVGGVAVPREPRHPSRQANLRLLSAGRRRRRVA